MYSFTVPSNWENFNSSGTGKGTEAFEPSKRDVGKYWIYVLLWTSPKTKDHLADPALIIESYKMKDGSSIPIDEVDKDLMYNLKKSVSSIDRKELPCKKNKQKRFLLTTMEARIHQGKYETVKSQSFYLIQEGNGITHRVRLSMSDEVYQLPESKELIQDIFDSFSTNIKN